MMSGCMNTGSKEAGELKSSHVEEVPYRIEKAENITRNATGQKVGELSFEQVIFEDKAYEAIS